MNKEKANKIFHKLNEEYKNQIQNDFYNLKTPYEILVFTVLSAQTTDKIVSKIIYKLFLIYPDVYSLSIANVKDVEKIIYSCGFFRKKSKSLIQMSKFICDNFNGKIPDSINRLLDLPGVGRKTANIVLSHAYFKNDGIAVDTHVKRLSLRLGLSASKNVQLIEKDLMSLYNKDYWMLINSLFIAHGRKICLSKNPKCNFCILKSFCIFK